MTIQQLHKKTEHAYTKTVCVVQLNLNGETLQFPISDAIVRERSDLGVNQVVMIVPITFHNAVHYTEGNGDQAESPEKKVHPMAIKLQNWMNEKDKTIEDVARYLEITPNSVDSWLAGRWGISKMNQANIKTLISSPFGMEEG